MLEMPGVGIGVMLFNENNEVLLLLRNANPDKAKSDMHLEGTWTLPAGKVKYGEINLGHSEEQVSYDFFSLEDLPNNLCIPSKTIINNYLEKVIYQGSSRKKLRKEERK